MQISFEEQEHLPNNQFIVIKGKHRDQCKDNTAKLENILWRDLFPNAKLYSVNLNKFSFDKHNQVCWFFLLLR